MNWSFDSAVADQDDYRSILHSLAEVERIYSCVALYRDPEGLLRCRGYVVVADRVRIGVLMRYLPQVKWTPSRGCSLMNVDRVLRGTIEHQQFGVMPKLGRPYTATL